MSNCESCSKRPPEPVPYVVHESDMARQERTIKRLWILLYVWRQGLYNKEMKIPEETLNSCINYCLDEYVRLTEHRSILRDHWFEGKSTKELADWS